MKTPLTHRDYSNLISQEDSNHFLVYKTRRCFLYRNQYFQLDIYKDPCHDRCRVSKRLRGFGSKCFASVDFENILDFSFKSRLIINSCIADSLTHKRIDIKSSMNFHISFLTPINLEVIQ